MKKGIVITLILMLVLAVSLMAQAPTSFVYQGRLTTPAGAPITTTTSVTFRVYEAADGGSPVQTWTVDVSPDANGVFTTELTSMSRTYFDGPKLYMEMVIGAQTLAPRQLITSVPYAYSSEYTNTATTVVDNSISSAKIVNGTITGSDVADASLNGADIENSGLTAADILDEPGIASTFLNSSVAIPDAFALADSVSIATPAAGYVRVTLEGFASITADGSGNVGNARAQISSSRPVSISTVEALAGTNGGNIGASAIWWGSMSAEKIYYNAAAGTYKYFLSVDQGDDDGTAYLLYYHFDAEYIPTSRGTIVTVFNSNDNEFDDASAIEVPMPGSETPEFQKIHIVNLREMEIQSTIENNATKEE